MRDPCGIGQQSSAGDGQLDAPAPVLGLEAAAQRVLYAARIFHETKPVFDVAQRIDTAHVVELTPQSINDTLGALLKYQDDIAQIQGSEAARLLGEIQTAALAE